jgi:hypothetical protein
MNSHRTITSQTTDPNNKKIHKIHIKLQNHNVSNSITYLPQQLSASKRGNEGVLLFAHFGSFGVARRQRLDLEEGIHGGPARIVDLAREMVNLARFHVKVLLRERERSHISVR